MREVVILKALSFDRKVDYLKTLLITKSVTLDQTQPKAVQDYNDLIKQYEDAFYYKSPQITSTDKDITEDMLARLIGDRKKKKVSKHIFTTADRVSDELNNVTFSELSKTLIKK